MFSMNSLSQVFSRMQMLRIEEVGAPDAFGYATCRLDDGSFFTVKSPVKGMVAKIVEHPAEIVRHETCDKIIITPWKEASFEMSMEDIHNLVEGKKK